MQCLAFIIDSYIQKIFVFIVWSFLFLKQECTVEYVLTTNTLYYTFNTGLESIISYSLFYLFFSHSLCTGYMVHLCNSGSKLSS